ncbi:MAG: flagellar hook-basal body complex protein FliE [Planctomycetota bacterium]
MPSPSDVFGLELASMGESPSAGVSKLGELLIEGVGHVNKMQTDADEMVHSMLTGGDVNEAEVLTAVQKADLAFRMLMQIRNKLMDAYREVQQIQI